MSRALDRMRDDLKRLQDLREHLFSKTGVRQVTPLKGRGPKAEIEVISALLHAKGSELIDRMQRPRETATERSVRTPVTSGRALRGMRRYGR